MTTGYFGTARSFTTYSQDSTTASTLTITANTRPILARITVETENIRYRYDGTAPTTTVGHIAYAGTTFTLEGLENIERFRMIADMGTSTVSVTLEEG